MCGCGINLSHPVPFADRRKIIEIANVVQAVPDGRVSTSVSAVPFSLPSESPAEYHAGIELAIVNGWLWRHASGLAGPACLE